MPNAADTFQWNNNNIFDSWDLNPLASTIGGGADGVRDTLSAKRDAFLQPKMQAYRDAVGPGKADATDTGLFNDPNFRGFVQNGQLPANASPAQQWNAQPAPQQASPGGDLMNLLMQRIQRPDVTANDPTVRSQADAYSANQTRGSRNYIADLAEKAGPLANLQGESRMASERAAQASGSFEAETLARVQAQRAQEIEQELQLYGSLLSDQQRMALQRELQQMQLQQNQSQFGASQAQAQDQFLRELALREAGQNNAFDLGWAQLGI